VEILAGTTSSAGRSRALFKFDLTQLPADASVTSVAFTIQVVKKNPSGVGSIFDLHRLLKDWGEGVGTGGQGSLANANEATWDNRFHPSTPWTPAGGGAEVDYVGAASSSTFIDDIGSYSFASTPSLV